jgi:hypothetical protein
MPSSAIEIGCRTTSLKRTDFVLSKWYLDCVTDDGEVFIGYVASLRWGKISISYSSTLRYAVGKPAAVNTTLRKSATPRIEGSCIKWASPQLDLSGTWSALAQPIERVLLETDNGSIEWNCLQPRSRAEVLIGQNKRFEGFGYVEHLTMSIPPWQIPIDELRWGRFLSEDDALVWINWKGVKPLNLVFHNGLQVADAMLTEHRLEAPQFALNLAENAVLREGPLARTALSMIPGVSRLFPVQILRARECKWVSRGVLKNTETNVSAGWAIHETVRFQ